MKKQMSPEKIWTKFQSTNRLTEANLQYLLEFYGRLESIVSQADTIYHGILFDVRMRLQTLRNIDFARKNY